MNENKTIIIPFSLSEKCNKPPTSISSIKLHNSNCCLIQCKCPIIKESSEVKYLGIIFDNHLNRTNTLITFVINYVK